MKNYKAEILGFMTGFSFCAFTFWLGDIELVRGGPLALSFLASTISGLLLAAGIHADIPKDKPSC